MAYLFTPLIDCCSNEHKFFSLMKSSSFIVYDLLQFVFVFVLFYALLNTSVASRVQIYLLYIYWRLVVDSFCFVLGCDRQAKVLYAHIRIQLTQPCISEGLSPVNCGCISVRNQANKSESISELTFLYPFSVFPFLCPDCSV